MLLQNVFGIRLFWSFLSNVSHFYIEAGQDFQMPAFVDEATFLQLRDAQE